MYQPKETIRGIGEPPSLGSPVQRAKNNLSISLSVDTSEIDRIAIGIRLYDALQWRGCAVNLSSILSNDKETKDIIIKESDLLKQIQLVNPLQPDRHIRLIKD